MGRQIEISTRRLGRGRLSRGFRGRRFWRRRWWWVQWWWRWFRGRRGFGELVR
jgi:hypothetical protein